VQPEVTELESGIRTSGSLQKFYNTNTELDETGDLAQQDTSSHLHTQTDIGPNRNRVREDLKGHTGARVPVLLYRLEIESHKIEQAIQTLHTNPRNITPHRCRE